MEQRTNGVDLEFKELFEMLIHRIWLIALISFLGALFFGVVSKYFIPPIYTSTTKIYVISRQDETKMTLNDLQTGAQLTQDYMVLVRSRPVMQRVIESLKLNITEEDLKNMINVVTPEGTRILEISVNYYDPVMTKRIADAIAVVSSEQMINIMEIKRVNIVEEGNMPLTPSSPNIYSNTILGGMIGLILSCAVLIIIHTLNDAIKTSEDIEKYLGIITLGLIPLEEGAGKRRKKTRFSY